MNLGDLKDVSLKDPISSSDVLVYNEQTKHWENRALEDLLETYNPTTSIAVDGNSIESVDGELKLKDFGTGYFAYVPAVKDEQTGEIKTPSTYEYTEGLKDGLEIRVTTIDGKLSLAWYEPNSEQIDNLTNSVTKISTTVNDLKTSVENLRTIKADIDSVYTKTQTNTAIQNALQGLYTKTETDNVIAEALKNIYTKTEVYTKEETDTAIGAAVAAAGHLKRKKLNSGETIDVTAEDADQYIYMVPTGLTEDDDKYDEYMVIDGIVEKVGSWEVNLSNYATTKYVNEELNKKVDAVAGSRLITEKEAEKLEALQLNGDDLQISGKINTSQITDLEEWLETNANTVKGLSKNNFTDDLYTKLNNSLYITSVNQNQMAVTEGQLSIKAIDKGIVTGLSEVLASKADASVVDNLNKSVSTNSANITSISATLNTLTNSVNQNTTDIAELKDCLTWKDI